MRHRYRLPFFLSLSLILAGCADSTDPAAERIEQLTADELPALLINADDRCTLIDRERNQLAVACQVEGNFTPQIVRIGTSPCGAYRFLRNASTPAVCEQGCIPSASALPGCPLKHQSGDVAWAFLDLR